MIQPLFEHRQTLAGYDTRVLELEGDGAPIVMFHVYAPTAPTRGATRWPCWLVRAGARSPSICPGSAPPSGSAGDRSCPSSTTVPVLPVWGDRDRLVFHRGAQRVLDAVPGERLELLPGIGHCPQVEAPDRFAELLVEFGTAVEAEAAA